MTKRIKIKLPEQVCQRCGHRWIPRKDEVRKCPKCQSVWWDRPAENEEAGKDDASAEESPL